MTFFEVEGGGEGEFLQARISAFMLRVSSCCDYITKMLLHDHHVFSSKKMFLFLKAFENEEKLRELSECV